MLICVHALPDHAHHMLICVHALPDHAHHIRACTAGACALYACIYCRSHAVITSLCPVIMRLGLMLAGHVRAAVGAVGIYSHVQRAGWESGNIISVSQYNTIPPTLPPTLPLTFPPTLPLTFPPANIVQVCCSSYKSTQYQAGAARAVMVDYKTRQKKRKKRKGLSIISTSRQALSHTAHTTHTQSTTHDTYTRHLGQYASTHHTHPCIRPMRTDVTKGEPPPKDCHQISHLHLPIYTECTTLLTQNVPH